MASQSMASQSGGEWSEAEGVDDEWASSVDGEGSISSQTSPAKRPQSPLGTSSSSAPFLHTGGDGQQRLPHQPHASTPTLPRAPSFVRRASNTRDSVLQPDLNPAPLVLPAPPSATDSGSVLLRGGGWSLVLAGERRAGSGQTLACAHRRAR